MKKYLKIQNKGEIDLELLYLIGGTTKDEDSTKIGRFGTGLKYCLAYLLRNNIDLVIYIGAKRIELSKKKKSIRDVDFDVIVIDDRETPLTTKLGVDFKPWMVVRELYSNALDEGEAKYEIIKEEEISGIEDTTSFFIEMMLEFIDVYNNWTKYFVIDLEPIYENEKFAIYLGSGDGLKIYKQGILIREEKIRSIFNYDIKEAHINELREYQGYHLPYDISEAIFKIKDRKTIEYFLESLEDDKLYEYSIDFSDADHRGEFSEVWKEVLGSAKIIHPEAKQRILGVNPNADLENTVVVSEQLYKALTKQFEGIGILRAINKVQEFYEIYDERLNQKLNECLTILEECKYFVHPELKFIFGDFGDKSVDAKVNLDTKEVFISHKIKDKSMFDFCSILIEENEHFQTGMEDNTREFQQHFIDLYTKKLLELHQIKL